MGAQALILQFSYPYYILELILFEFKNFARLAIEFVTYSLECRETDGLALAGLENRKIGRCDTNALGELRECHSATRQHQVEFNFYSHLLPNLVISTYEGSEKMDIYQIPHQL